MAYRPSEGRNQKKATPPVQPSLIPIMNLFLAIMPFLLMMVVITQVAMVALNFSASGGGGAGAGAGGGGGDTKEIKIIIMNSSGNEMYPGYSVVEPGDVKTAYRNAENRGEFNFVALNKKLAEIKKVNADVSSITLVVYPDVQYGTMIQTIDLCKQNGFPNVVYKPATVGYAQGGN
jgi:biopolymer transport protein ExbD